MLLLDAGIEASACARNSTTSTSTFLHSSWFSGLVSLINNFPFLFYAAEAGDNQSALCSLYITAQHSDDDHWLAVKFCQNKCIKHSSMYNIHNSTMQNSLFTYL